MSASADGADVSVVVNEAAFGSADSGEIEGDTVASSYTGDNRTCYPIMSLLGNGMALPRVAPHRVRSVEDNPFRRSTSERHLYFEQDFEHSKVEEGV